MNLPITGAFDNLVGRLVGFLPSFAGGLLLLLLGWFIAWFMKRIAVQLCVTLRVDRLFQNFRWGKDFYKADVRYAFFNLIGNFIFAILLFVFVDNALILWNLHVISTLLEKGVLFFPNLLLAAVIFASGWAISSFIATAIHVAFVKERIPLAGMISRFAKTVLIVFFSAMSLVQLQLAPVIVIIGFTTVFVTVGIIIIILASFAGKEIVRRLMESIDRKE
ncbi:MAG: hypothetical protein PHV36_09235 [Elusimicrobiales bacterium]|nr:hypothetical protein [Elusimicrobiales bacterium]